MKIYDTVYLAALNLYRRWVRSLLTVVGVVIGTCSIILMVSIGLTNLAQFDKMLESAEFTQIQVVGPNYGSEGRSSIKLDDAAIKALGNLDHVNKVVPTKNLLMYGEIGNYYANYLSVMAVPAGELPYMVELKEGRYPSENSSMPEVIIGMGVARQFIQDESDYQDREYQGPSIDWLNSTIDLYYGDKDILDNSDVPSSRRYKARVVGIIKDEDDKNPSYAIYMDLDKGKNILQNNYKLAKALNQQINTYELVYVYASTMDKVRDLIELIKDYGFEAYSQTEWIEGLLKQQRSQLGQLAAIGLISLVVSAIGIANTMMTGVLERRREIGIMKVIGFSLEKIRFLFLVEAAMIGFLGGMAGMLFSHLFAYILSTKAEETIFLGMYFSAGIKMIIPIWLDLTAIGVSIIVGIIAGILPANRATKMSPLDAIKA